MRAGEEVEVAVLRVGSRGDGIARHDGVTLFVPWALPGDRLRVRVGGRRGDGFSAHVVTSLEAAPRAQAPCPHFGTCGGCQLQHLPAGDYAAWQRRQVEEALARRGLGEVPVEAPVITPPGSRRRVRLAWAGRAGALRLGFRERASHAVVDVAACPVACPEIVAAIAPLRALLRRLPMARSGGEAQVTAAGGGLDLLLLCRRPPALEDRQALAGFAADHDLARVAWQAAPQVPAEPVVARRPVTVTFGGIGVELPPGAFLQATREAEAALRAAVEAALGDATRLADLFAGCGTFALPLAGTGRRVRAVEADPAMLQALTAAARRAGLAVEAERRDLDRAPLTAAELAGLHGVVLDPPRAGARAQAATLAGSRVSRIALVSCHPGTFARDARTLVDGGYRLLWVRPIDPFLWSAEIELVGAFAR